MDKEVSGHNDSNNWEIAEKAKINAKIIKSIWSFKQKCTPARKIVKHKARIYAHSRIQH